MRILSIFFLLIVLLNSCKDSDYEVPIVETAYRELKDTSYGDDTRHKLDLYLPENRSSNTKLLLMIHGGAWTSGSKSDLTESALALRKLDPTLAIANINYRYVNGKNVLIQDQINDLDKAIKFILSNRSNFNISNKISLVGASSGSHLAMMYAYKYDNEKVVKSVGNYFGPTRIDMKEWYDSYNLGLLTPVKDILHPLFGQTWNQELYSSYSPYTILTTANGKPTISFHGGIDLVVPKDQSKDLDAKLKQISIPTEYHEYPNSIFHVLIPADLNDSYPKLLNFINKYW